MGNGFTLRQFSDVFQVRKINGVPYILVGGQAVNYWAEYYLAAEPDLKKYAPFASADIDFQGNREDVRHIAGQLGLPAVYPDKVNMTALAGAVPFQIGKHRSIIEIVRSIPGISATMVDELAVEAMFDGQQIRVLDPVSMVLNKANLALTVSQAGRQDIEHLKILILCARGFLRELLLGVERGHLPAKGWLGAVNRLLELAKSTHGRKISNKFGVCWLDVLPQSEIATAKDRKIIAFREKQLVYSIKKLALSNTPTL